jgi:hypothetical protein
MGNKNVMNNQKPNCMLMADMYRLVETCSSGEDTRILCCGTIVKDIRPGPLQTTVINVSR